jgi:uroporphyrinogen-III synthase
MAQTLEGKRIAIAGSRKIEEMSALIERKGGVPVIRPMQGTVFLAEEELEVELRELAKRGADWFVFTTGGGLEAIFALADKLGVAEQLTAAVKKARIASRGYKTYAALKQLGIIPDAADDDGTTRGLVRALEAHELAGRRVVVQLHGEPSPALIDFLAEQGADVGQIMPYRHVPPESETAEQLCLEIMERRVDAVCFTTALQARNLFHYAEQQGYAERLRQAFRSQVLAAAVGKVTAEALRDAGVGQLLMPESERMGAMVVALSDYYAAP